MNYSVLYDVLTCNSYFIRRYYLTNFQGYSRNILQYNEIIVNWRVGLWVATIAKYLPQECHLLDNGQLNCSIILSYFI